MNIWFYIFGFSALSLFTFLKFKKLQKWFFLYLILNVLLLLALTVNLFIRSSGGFKLWEINPEHWGFFGSFIGALLLVATLIFQAISFRRQQIEAKFFELVKYYRDNVAEMQLKNPFYYTTAIAGKKEQREFEERIVTGRRVFKLIFDQYRVAYGICRKLNLINESNYRNVIKGSEYESYLKLIKKDNNNHTKVDPKIRFIENEVAFLLTFWGVPEDISDEIKDRFKNQFELQKIVMNDKEVLFLEYVKSFKTVFEHDSPESYSGLLRKLRIFYKLKENEKKNVDLPDINNNTSLKFFGGHQYHLGHYFRHLYQAVSYIDKQPWYILDENEKYQYVKTLRAQMSNYEQALLFINSLTVLGRNWEYAKKDNARLISDYNMIKNLPKHFVPEMNPQVYYPEVDFEWEKNDHNFKVVLECKKREKYYHIYHDAKWYKITDGKYRQLKPDSKLGEIIIGKKENDSFVYRNKQHRVLKINPDKK